MGDLMKEDNVCKAELKRRIEAYNKFEPSNAHEYTNGLCKSIHSDPSWSNCKFHLYFDGIVSKVLDEKRTAEPIPIPTPIMERGM